MADRNELRKKSCAVCGRSFSWRAAWSRDWDIRRYCSERCRKHRVTPTDERLAATTLALLGGQAAGTTICPSQVARAVDTENWRELMEPTRAAARRLVAQGLVVITQGGRVVDPSTAKGPYASASSRRLPSRPFGADNERSDHGPRSRRPAVSELNRAGLRDACDPSDPDD